MIKYRKIIDLLMFCTALFVAFIFQLIPRYKNVWIITERRDECKDNGYHFFKYMRTEHPKMKVYYAINKNSEQKNKILKFGNIIDNNSWKHYLYALMATRLIGAFIPCGIPDSIFFYKFGNLIKGKKVFLQHGITKESNPFLFYNQTGIDTFICGAKPEYDVISKQFNYPAGNVVYTGFARYDALHDFKIQKFILVMPTWRQWIISATWGNGEKSNPDNYEYFRVFKQLICNEDVRNILRINNMKMIFYPHHETQQYLDYFGQADEVVTTASEKDYDVQELLKSCACLITDYSSVAFDVAYMRKPIIYYQFDEEEYYSKHYKKGYFDYDTMGFGRKCKKKDEVIDELIHIMDNDCNMEEKYKKRATIFFPLSDTSNCYRIYEAIE